MAISSNQYSDTHAGNYLGNIKEIISLERANVKKLSTNGSFQPNELQTIKNAIEKVRPIDGSVNNLAFAIAVNDVFASSDNQNKLVLVGDNKEPILGKNGNRLYRDNIVLIDNIPYEKQELIRNLPLLARRSGINEKIYYKLEGQHHLYTNTQFELIKDTFFKNINNVYNMAKQYVEWAPEERREELAINLTKGIIASAIREACTIQGRDVFQDNSAAGLIKSQRNDLTFKTKIPSQKPLFFGIGGWDKPLEKISFGNIQMRPVNAKTLILGEEKGIIKAHIPGLDVSEYKKLPESEQVKLTLDLILGNNAKYPQSGLRLQAAFLANVQKRWFKDTDGEITINNPTAFASIYSRTSWHDPYREGNNPRNKNKEFREPQGYAASDHSERDKQLRNLDILLSKWSPNEEMPEYWWKESMDVIS
jgi:hypothetical protein